AVPAARRGAGRQVEISGGRGAARFSSRWCLVTARCALALLLISGAGTALADAPADAAAQDGPAPAPSVDGQKPPLQRHKSGLPFLAEEALSRGYELPEPFGLGLILTGLDNRQIDVSDLRVGIDGSNQSVSEFATLGSSSTVFNANLRFDTWLL